MCAAVDSAASSSSETSPTSETKSSDIELFFNFFPLIMILCFSCSGLKKHIYYDVIKLLRYNVKVVLRNGPYLNTL